MSSSGAREESRDSVRCLVYLLEADRLCMRVNTLSAYAELNRLVASGATPFRPSEPQSKDGKVRTPKIGAPAHARAYRASSTTRRRLLRVRRLARGV